MVELQLRATNQNDSVTAPFVDFELELLTEAPGWADEDGGDDEMVGGYRRNPIAMRRRYDCQVPLRTIDAQGGYESVIKLLRAKRLYITGCTYNGGAHPRVGVSGAFWGGVEPTLPIEVRRTANSVVEETAAGSNSRLKWTVAFEDVRPTIGVVIT